MLNAFSFACVLFAALSGNAPGLTTPEFTLRDPRFRVEQIASSNEAHNIYCMTLNVRGEVVVSGPGYIRTLTDEDGDGYLENARDFYTDLPGGAMGLLADASGLYFVGGRGLERLDDADGDGRADGPPRLILPIKVDGEHNAHAVRRGADGSLYLIGGNFCGLQKSQLRGASSPVVNPYAGLLIRLRPDASSVEVLTNGLRNTYDFDFDARGEIFGFDSDGERDEGLPWYRGCRLYHLTAGIDCGWRSSGSGKVPVDAWDTVHPVGDVGRGSPTGVTTYLHTQFPARYRGGVFALDWTFGRILFFLLNEAGSTYRSRIETFATGSSSTPFAPVDIEVTPDGSLLVASGGRGLSGAIYRISWTAAPAGPSPEPAPIEVVLKAPMPLASWSRALWVDTAKAMDADVWLNALSDSERPTVERIRALDVLFELHGDRAVAAFSRLSMQRAPVPAALRSRAAWWAGRRGQRGWSLRFLSDPHPWVIRTAAESVVPFLAGRPELTRELMRQAAHPDRRVRQAIAATLSRLSVAELPRVEAARARLVRGMAIVLGTPWGQWPEAAFVEAEAVLNHHLAAPLTASRAWIQETFDALRLIELSFERLQESRDPRVVFHESWERVDWRPWRGFIDRVTPLMLRAGQVGDPTLTDAVARLLSLLAVSDSAAPEVVLSRITLSSPPGQDILQLSYLARVPRHRDVTVPDRIRDALLGLSWKVRAGGVSRDKRWHRFVMVMAGELFARYPALADRLLRDGRFGEPDHVVLAQAMPSAAKRQAAESFAQRALPSSAAERGTVVALLADHPDVARDRLRQAFDEPSLRAIVLNGLSKSPIDGDREIFLTALAGDDRTLVEPATRGLSKLAPPKSSDPEFTDAVLDLLRWGYTLDGDPAELPSRDRVAAELARLIDTDGGYQPTQKTSQREAFDALSVALLKIAPALAPDLVALREELQSDTDRVQEVLTTADWAAGDPKLGAGVYEQFGCNNCHHIGGRGFRVGPDLTGLGKRYDLAATVAAVGLPSREVAPQFRAELVILKDGTQVHGLPIYDSREAILFRTREGFLRVAEADIAERSRTSQSLMPSGYLDRMSVEQVAHLIAFLRQDG